MQTEDPAARFIASLAASVGAAAREARLALNLSQEAVAARVNSYGLKWQQTTVGRVEKGTRPLTVPELVALAAALELGNLPSLLGPDIDRFLTDTALRAKKREFDRLVESPISALRLMRPSESEILAREWGEIKSDSDPRSPLPTMREAMLLHRLQHPPTSQPNRETENEE